MNTSTTTDSTSIVDTITSGLRYHHLAGSTLATTFLVMILGAYTSAIGAGLSCPDWPTCYGTLIPFLQPAIIEQSPYTSWQIFAEWAHRGLAMTAGFLILGTAGAAWMYERNQSIILWSATLALVLLPIQILLGGLTVTQSLQPIIVTSHLGVATLILLCLAVTFTTSWLYNHQLHLRDTDSSDAT